MGQLIVPLTDNWANPNSPHTQYIESDVIRLLRDEYQSVSYGGLTRMNRPTMPGNTVLRTAFLVFDITENVSHGMRFVVDQINTSLNDPDGYFTVGTTGYDRARDYQANTPPGEYQVDIKDFLTNAFGFTGLRYSVVNISGNTVSSMTIQPKHLLITYDNIPNAPVIVSPNGGEILTGNSVISWTPPTIVTAPSSELKYEVQYSSDNESTWSTLTTTALGVTSYTRDFSTVQETSVGKVRIRAINGMTSGAWDVSDGIFTVQHNIPPYAPSNLSPSGTIVDRAITNRLTWKHNELNPKDIQSKADVQWRKQGEALWNVITVNGSVSETFISPNVLPAGQIEWRVRTYDQSGLVGPYSNLTVFTSSEPTNAPTIIQPTSPVNVSRPNVEWTSESQSSYQIVVEDSLGGVLWDTDEIVGNVKARTVGVDLLNGGTYKIKVRVKDGSGLFSSFNEKTVTVAYTPPAKPMLNAYKADAAIQLVISNPMPTGTQPIVLGNDIFKVINGEWVRIAANVSSTFTDYAVANGTEYMYFVVALGETETYSYSEEVTQSVTFTGAYIHDPLDAEFTVYRFKYNGIGVDTEFTSESALMKFAGRKRPVVQFGTYEDYAINITLQASRDMTPMAKLREFVANRTPVCYRDDNGEFLYGVIQSLPVRKEYRVATADITIIEIDYNVEV